AAVLHADDIEAQCRPDLVRGAVSAVYADRAVEPDVRPAAVCHEGCRATAYHHEPGVPGVDALHVFRYPDHAVGLFLPAARDLAAQLAHPLASPAAATFFATA